MVKETGQGGEDRKEGDKKEKKGKVDGGEEEVNEEERTKTNSRG